MCGYNETVVGVLCCPYLPLSYGSLAIVLVLSATLSAILISRANPTEGGFVSMVKAGSILMLIAIIASQDIVYLEVIKFFLLMSVFYWIVYDAVCNWKDDEALLSLRDGRSMRRSGSLWRFMRRTVVSPIGILILKVAAMVMVINWIF